MLRIPMRAAAERLCIRAPEYLEWFVSFVIAIGVVSSWRGAWVLVDSFLIPEHPARSTLASLALGTLLGIFLLAVQPSLAAWARAHAQWRFALWSADAVYTYLAFWVCVLVWRGVWYAWSDWFGLGLAPTEPGDAHHSGAISHAAGVFLLLLLGALRNNVASPMTISSDAKPPIFGASSTAGLGGLNPFERLRRPPIVQVLRDGPDLTCGTGDFHCSDGPAFHDHDLSPRQRARVACQADRYRVARFGGHPALRKDPAGD